MYQRKSSWIIRIVVIHFFPFKNLPNFTGIPATKISESFVSVISKLIFSTLFLSLVWSCLSCIPYFLHKAGQVVQGLIELIPFSPDFSNLQTCYSFSLTNKISNYRIYFSYQEKEENICSHN